MPLWPGTFPFLFFNAANASSQPQTAPVVAFFPALLLVFHSLSPSPCQIFSPSLPLATLNGYFCITHQKGIFHYLSVE
jgi:hypothetical protein